MSTGQRFLAVIALVLAMLFGLSLCGYRFWEDQPQTDALSLFDLASAESTPVELAPCMDEATREQMKALMLEALDEALKSHIENVFLIWLKDERGQPGRARTGVQQGLKAYLAARRGVESWAPPPCAG